MKKIHRSLFPSFFCFISVSLKVKKVTLPLCLFLVALHLLLNGPAQSTQEPSVGLNRIQDVDIGCHQAPVQGQRQLKLLKDVAAVVSDVGGRVCSVNYWNYLQCPGQGLAVQKTVNQLTEPGNRSLNGQSLS